MEMAMIALTQGMFKLLMATLAVITLAGTIIWLNRSTGNNFDASLRDASPDHRMVYFGLRFLGVALVVGLAIS